MNEPFWSEELKKLNIEVDLTEKKCPLSDIEHRIIVKKIAKFFKIIKTKQKNIKEEWKPAGEWLNYNKERLFFYNELLKNNINEADKIIKNFWRNKLGLIVKEYAKYEDLIGGNNEIIYGFTQSIGRNYLIWKDIFNKPDSSLRLKKFVGNPWGCIINGEFITPKSIRFHSNALQIKNLLSKSDSKIIAEIGGGYGGLGHYLCNEIIDCKYVNFDLPETLVLCAYYLSINFPDKKIYLGVDNNIEDLDDYDIFLLPNYLLEQFQDKSIDVFFNSFSLSEMPQKTNKAYLDEIARTTKNYFLHNNMDRKGVINRGFERLPSSLYSINPEKFILLNKNYDIFHSHFGDYKEFLYKVI